MSGKTGAGTSHGVERVTSSFMGFDRKGFGGVQAVEAGANKLNFLFLIWGKTKDCRSWRCTEEHGKRSCQTGTQ